MLNKNRNSRNFFRTSGRSSQTCERTSAVPLCLYLLSSRKLRCASSPVSPERERKNRIPRVPPFGKVGGIPMSRQERTVDNMEGYKTANWFATSECFIVAFFWQRARLQNKAARKKVLLQNVAYVMNTSMPIKAERASLPCVRRSHIWVSANMPHD